MWLSSRRRNGNYLDIISYFIGCCPSARFSVDGDGGGAYTSVGDGDDGTARISVGGGDDGAAHTNVGGGVAVILPVLLRYTVLHLWII